MPRQTKYHLTIEIDKLTNSVINAISGKSFQTEIIEVSEADLKQVTKKNNWTFNWKFEYKSTDRKVYKLIVKSDPAVIQGLISISDYADHFFLHLIESAPFNRGKEKLYEGVPGNLVAFACKCSWDKGYEGVLGFRSKTLLIEHYEKTLGAEHLGGHKMAIFSKAALLLIKKYFPIL